MDEPRPARSAFGALLRRYRVAAGLSQEALAERARMSTSGIGALERGDRRVPYRETVKLLAEALNLGPAEQMRLESTAARPRPGAAASAAGAVRDGVRRRHNLPLSLTSFHGRIHEIEELRELLGRRRAITLVGAGGVGKTRLAVETLASFAHDVPDGAWFVDLASLRDPTLVVASIAAVFGIQQSAGTSLLDSLSISLQPRELILLLDNCEHLLASCAEVCEALLRACPRLRIVATSREPLRTDGEYLFRVPSLGVPPLLPELDRHEVSDFPAVALFLERARAIGYRAIPDKADHAAIGSICRRLDGIPLAIELAAARTSSMDVAQIEARLASRFTLLTNGRRTALSRQQTLREALEWSFDLLTPVEQQFLCRLAVFANSCTVEAAEKICADGETIASADVVGLLGALFDKSLVVAVADADVPRYGMLETTRAYALERLERSAEFAALHARLAAHCLEVLLQAEKDDRDHAAGALRPGRLAADLDNFRSALAWSLRPGGGNPKLGGRLLYLLRGQLRSSGFSADGIGWAQTALALLGNDADAALTAGLELALAQFYLVTGPISAALTAAQRAVSHYERLDDRGQLAEALQRYGMATQWLGRRRDAELAYERALAIARDLREPRLIAWLLWRRAECSEPDDLETRVALLREASSIFEGIGDESGNATIRAAFGEAAYLAGDIADAVADSRAALAAFQRLGNRTNAAATAADIAGYSCAAGEFEEARTFAREALATGREVGAAMTAASAIGHLAAVAAARAQGPEAARLLGAAELQFALCGQEPGCTERSFHERTRAALRVTLGDDEALAALIAEGARWNTERAVKEALLI
jgi:predicted ATPase/DNA-binding XRE family transcriptional regulator